MGQLDDYRLMARIRRFEERLTALKDAGEIPGSIHLCNGQEAIPVGACRALRDGDHVTATYRGHGEQQDDDYSQSFHGLSSFSFKGNCGYRALGQREPPRLLPDPR